LPGQDFWKNDARATRQGDSQAGADRTAVVGATHDFFIMMGLTNGSEINTETSPCCMLVVSGLLAGGRSLLVTGGIHPGRTMVLPRGGIHQEDNSWKREKASVEDSKKVVETAK